MTTNSEKCRSISLSVGRWLLLGFLILGIQTFGLAQAGPNPATDVKPTTTTDQVPGASQGSKPTAPSVTSVYRDDIEGLPDNAAAKKDKPKLKLGDTIVLEIDGLESYLKAANDAKTSVWLFLDGRPQKGVLPDPPTDTKKGLLKFPLEINTDSDAVWTHLLSRPTSRLEAVRVSIGTENNGEIPSIQTIELAIVTRDRLFGGVGIFLFSLAVFIYFAKISNILRDDSCPKVPGYRPPFSLARVQAAWWFFLIFGSFIIIGIITFKFSDTLNSTALILLGISAATTVGSVVIDANKAAATDTSSESTVPSSTQAQIEKAVDEMKSITDQLQRAGSDPKLLGDPAASNVQPPTDRASLLKQKKSVASTLRNLGVISDKFLNDILSDINGVSFHRYQIFAWTILLGIIFVMHVMTTLAMPEFNSTLLGLMGVSSGTYLSVKIAGPAKSANPTDVATQ